MLIGFNNDVEHRGMTFHIQTEDHGESDCLIETQLFYSGAILDTLITSYEETVEGFSGKAAEERIRAQMKASHRSLFKKLRAGDYDEMVGLDPADGSDTGEIDVDAEDFTPSQERVPAEAQRIEEGGEEAIREFEKKQGDSKRELSHVSLDKLKDQLSALKQPSEPKSVDATVEESVANEETALATQIMDSSGFGFEFSSSSSEAAASEKAERNPSARIIDFPETGAEAWTGCKPCKDELSLVDLVEEFLAM